MNVELGDRRRRVEGKIDAYTGARPTPATPEAAGPITGNTPPGRRAFEEPAAATMNSRAARG